MRRVGQTALLTLTLLLILSLSSEAGWRLNPHTKKKDYYAILKATKEDAATSTTDSASGLEYDGRMLTLLQGCDDNQILVWDESEDDWNCEAQSGGGGSGDEFTVNSTAADTTANVLDNIYAEWALADGGAGGPDDVTVKPDFDQTLAGNPALEVDEWIPFKDASGGGILAEGSTADSNEQLYRLPNVNTADSTEYLVVADDANVSGAEAGWLDGVTAAIADTDDTLAVFGATTSAQLTGILTNEDGSGLCAAGLICVGGHEHAGANLTDDIFLLTAGDAMTAELFVDALGLEFEPGDALTDCSTFLSTGGGIFYDDSEGVLKKCQDNTLTDLDTGGAETNSLETLTTGIADAEILLGDGADSAIFTAIQACAADEKLEYTAGSPDTITCEAIGSLVDADISNTLTASIIDLEAGTVTNIADTEIMVGVGAADASYVTISGDATLANTGALTVVDDSHAHVAGDIDAAASATWIARVSDETGTGLWVFATAPTFTTSITSTLVIADLIDPSGAVDLDFGSADVTDMVFETDGGTVTLDGSGTFTGTSQSTIEEGLVVNNAQGGDADDDFQVHGDVATNLLHVDASTEVVVLDGAIDVGTVETFADTDADPDVSSGSFWNTFTNALTITDFDGANIVTGQLLYVVSKGAITFDVDGGLLEAGANDLVTADGDLTVWIYDGDDWILVSFTDQSDDLS